MPSGPRIRTDNVFGTLTDNPLTNVATTMNSAGLANLAAVSSAHALAIIDPLRSAGAPEMVIVTAHTASATSATITRGAYGTTARQHAQGVLWVHAPSIEDAIRIVTSSTRPSDPYEGQVAYETDTNRWAGYDGSTWQPSLHNPPACRVYNTGTQALNNATTTAITFDSERYDTDSIHSTSSNTSRLTFATAGLYSIGGTVSLTGETDYTSIVVLIRLNGTTSIGQTRLLAAGTFSADQPTMQVHAVYKFAANDYVELCVIQENTSANSETTVVAANHSPEFWATWIGVG